jgi:uncharacterized membrane protein YfcA
MIGGLVTHWRLYLGICTSVAAILPIGHAFFFATGNDWVEWPICFALTAVIVYALVTSRWFSRTDDLSPWHRRAVFAIGIFSTVVVSVLLCGVLAVGGIVILAMIGPASRSDGPVEVKFARNPWTGKLK